MNAADLPDETLFENALACRTPGERTAYLDRACAGQPELRRRLEALLAAHEASGEFLEPPAAARPDLPLDETAGSVIGRYKLLQKIGEGGMGVVYMAEQTEPVVRKVALKIIKLGMDTKAVVARFEAERQALALMDHPNIARVLDAGATETGRPYFVMELVHGVPITEYCDQNRLTTKERLGLFIPVCQAIHHAHQKGIIHRDIKPSNVMVTLHDGVPVPKVIDFGVAKATNQRLTEKTLFTHYAQMIGTPAYMSPEQAEMSGLDIDTRSDIYSLGVLLYELLTGSTPFTTTELLSKGYAEMARIITQQAPPKPSTRMSTLREEEKTAVATNRSMDAGSLRRWLQGDVDWIVMKSLEKDRSRRYETVNGLAGDIGRYLRNEPIVARPPSKLYELQKAVRRHRLGFALATTSGLMLLLGVVGLWISNSRIRSEQREKIKALEAATRSEQEARQQLFTSLKRQAEARRYSRQMGQRTESLAAVAAAARIHKDDELRDIAIAAMAVADFRPGPSWQMLTSNDVAFAFDANYRRYAVVDKAGVITIRSAPDGRELQQFVTGLPALPMVTCRGLEFSPDGRLLAKLEPGYQWSVWRLGNAQLLFRTPSDGCSAIAFSRDSRRLAVGNTNHVTVFAAETGQELKQWSVAEMPHSMQFSPDDRLLAVGSTRAQSSTHLTTVRIHDPLSGRLIKELPIHSTFDQSLSWHPSGKYLAASCIFSIHVWDVEAVVKVSELQRHASLVTAVAFSPDGTLVISDAWDGAPRLWSPSPGQELIHCLSADNFFRFSPDGRWAGVLWNMTGQARLLEVIPSPEYQTFFASRFDAEHSYQTSDISPRDDLLALGSSVMLSLRELPNGREIASLPVGYLSAVKFTPDGDALITCGPKAGLQYWPLTKSSPSKLRLGPARQIPLPFKPYDIALDREGKFAAIASESSDGVALLNLRTGELEKDRFRHESVRYIALSPDAQWLAAGGFHSRELKVWNVRTGDLVRQQAGLRFFPSFTPDGRELLVAQDDGFRFYSTDSWQATRKPIPSEKGYCAWPAFARDGRLMAVGTGPGIIELLEASTGRVLARLEDPNGHIPLWMGFCAGDTQLLAISDTARAIHRWDLAAIRAHLKSLGLDWDWPEFPPSSAEENPPPPLEIEVVSGSPP